MGSLHSIGASPSTTLWGGVHGNGETRRAKERSSKGREGGVLGEGMFPSPPARGSGERCSKLLLWVRGEAPR